MWAWRSRDATFRCEFASFRFVAWILANRLLNMKNAAKRVAHIAAVFF